jgi:cold shock CspA family protein
MPSTRPLDLKFECHDVELHPEWRDRIGREFERIQKRISWPILHARARIVGTRHHRHGAYEVRLGVSIPGQTFVVSAQGNLENPLLTEVFDALQRKLDEHARRARGEVKPHPSAEHGGRIVSLHPVRGFGFIRPFDDSASDVYFHQHSVQNYNFFALNVGDTVHFVEEAGDEGPQASWVRVDEHSGR